MSPPLLDVTAAGAAAQTAKVLAAGGTVVLPTDTVYGLGALPGIAAATARLFEAKGRRFDVPVAVLCASVDQALDLADLADPAVADRARRWAADHWPGPLTMVLPRRPDLDWDLGEPSDTIGVRVPESDFVTSVATEIGPIAVTSANRHGSPTPPSALEAAESLAADVGLVVDGGRLEASASTVVDVARASILRSGPVDLGL